MISAIDNISGELFCEFMKVRDCKNMGLLLNAFPNVCERCDFGGRLPLHRVVDTNNQTYEVVYMILAANPDAVKVKDNGGRLPIHFCLLRENANIDVVRLLIDSYPSSLLIPDNKGQLPIHTVLSHKQPNFHILKLIIISNPSSVIITNKDGNLPLHLILHYDNIPMDIIILLLQIYPLSILVSDNHGKLPMEIANIHQLPSNIMKLLQAAEIMEPKDRPSPQDINAKDMTVLNLKSGISKNVSLPLRNHYVESKGRGGTPASAGTQLSNINNNNNDVSNMNEYCESYEQLTNKFIHSHKGILS